MTDRVDEPMIERVEESSAVGPPLPERGPGRPALLGAGVLAGLVLLVAIAAVIGATVRSPRLAAPPFPTGPAVTAPPPWQRHGLELTIGELATAELPRAPFPPPSDDSDADVCAEGGDDGSQQAAQSDAAIATDPVSRWRARVFACRLDSSVSATQPRDVAVNVAISIATERYGSSSYAKVNSPAPVGVPAGFTADQAARMTFGVDLSVPGGAATAEQVVIIVLKLDAVNAVTWVSIVPNNLPQAQQAAIRASERSIRQR